MAIDRTAALKNAEKLLRQGKLDQAIVEYARVVEDQPADWTTRNTLGDLCVRAGQTERAVAEYAQIADAFRNDGFFPKAGALYRKILKISPGNEHAQLQGAEIAAAQGLLRDARDGFTAVLGGRRARGDASGALAMVVRLGRLDASDVSARLAAADALVSLGDPDAAKTDLQALSAELAEKQDERVSVVLDALARLSPGDLSIAVAALEAQLIREPQNIGALAKLVEAAVDAGLEDKIIAAQARLAEAHLASGTVIEARWIAEDLVSRHPDDEAHVERLRRVLNAAGETNVEALIAALGQTTTLDAEPSPAVAESVHAAAPASRETLAVSTAAASPALESVELVPSTATGPVAPVSTPPVPRATPAPAAPQAVSAEQRHATIEVDLSIVLDQIHKAPDATAAPTTDLDDVFAQMRDEARRRVALDAAEQDYRRGVSAFQAGQIDDAIAAFESAARLPRFRFEAASLLGRIFLNRGNLASAIEWLERAAEAPSPSADEQHKVLYNLADALESAGETTRALAVSLQLQALAGRFLDVAVRIKRLATAQERG